MPWKIATVATIAALLLLSSAHMVVAQEDETYDFDGVADMDPQPVDPTDWMTSENWSDSGADPLPPFGPAIPDFGTRVEIQTSTFGVNAPVIGPGDTAEAFEVRIARFGGEGLLTMTGGTLTTVNSCSMSPFTCNRRLRVGAADVGEGGPAENRYPGTFNLSEGTVTTDSLWIGSGSKGQMNMSGGIVNTRGDLSFDWTFDAGSNLNITAGTINVGSDLRMYRNSSLDLNGGTILIANTANLGFTDANITQTPNVSVNILSGLLQANNALRVQGSVVVDGGILRAGSFNELLSMGTIEINGSGLLQFKNAQESASAVQGLITSGFFTTSSASPLSVSVVDVGGTDYTQVSSASPGLLGDFDNDGDVDGSDFLRWQRGDSPNGVPGVSISPSDLTDWQGNYGAPPLSAVVAVPEPATGVLVLFFSIALLSRAERDSTKSVSR
ncbi:hypothetical protein [Bythopirellula polymerisocia]|uniref:Uncharacterized protein n=1 Tax=Bythopirellula polymerisocia TaxID=2528003 RepID=A0A5C6BZC3_9BACT|nr:hypothetical protein [Bythopirellula polymerisocia]TWU17593.1 hypothetical protein Pla144_51150 [Bythopirellula polymerisocia]